MMISTGLMQIGGALALVFVLTFFILVRPQLKRQQSHMNFLGSLMLGDHIVTCGGLIGQITKFDRGDTVHIKLSDTTHVLARRSSIEERYVNAS
jgi:preprotein translocase subunit YajC